MRPRHHPLVRELTIALVCKVAALALIYVVCFGPANRIEVTPERMATMVFGPAATR